MRKCILLLVLTLVVLASSDTLSATAVDKQSNLPSTVVENAVEASINDKRMLRASDGIDAVEEERGMTELGTKLRVWVKNLKTWVTNPMQTIKQLRQILAQKKRAWQVERWVKKDVSNIDLYRKQVTLDEYFSALKLDPELKIHAGSAAARAKNPGLAKYYTYSTYIDYVRAVD